MMGGKERVMPFTTEQFFDLFTRYNTAIWPAQIAALLAGLVILVLILRRPSWNGRVIALILAAAFLGPAWGYFLTRHAFINWVATYYGYAFLAQAVLLLLVGGLGGRWTFRTEMSRRRCIGLALFLFALLLQPLLGLFAGRPVSQAEVFGVMPDPTAVAALGLVLAADRMRWLLLLVPVLWCAVAGATLWTMGAPAFFVPPAAAVLVIFLSVLRAINPEGR